jgi:uncharacterized protein (DUF1499 family)
MSKFTDDLKQQLRARRAAGTPATRVRMCASQYRLIESDFGVNGRSVDNVPIELDESVAHREFKID